MKKLIVLYSFLVILFIATLILISGCGFQVGSPGDTAQKFINAINHKQFELYLSHILPDQVKKELPTEKDKNSMKKEFGSGGTGQSFSDINFKVKIDSSNRARVILISGKVTNKVSSKSEKKSKTTNISKLPEWQRTLYLQKYKGKWYVDMEGKPNNSTAPSPTNK
jgi:hypothetical protein